jgi:hypothetical protein
MTALMHMAPLMGLPKMDIATMLGTMFSTDPSIAFAIGLAMHFMLVLGLLAVGGITGALLGHTAVGLFFGVLLAMPLVGVG